MTSYRTPGSPREFSPPLTTRPPCPRAKKQGMAKQHEDGGSTGVPCGSGGICQIRGRTRNIYNTRRTKRNQTKMDLLSTSFTSCSGPPPFLRAALRRAGGLPKCSPHETFMHISVSPTLLSFPFYPSFLIPAVNLLLDTPRSVFRQNSQK